MMHLDDTAHILGSADFFSICNLEQRRMLAFASDRIRLTSGETLFRAGQITDGAYVLISGEMLSNAINRPEEEGIVVNSPGTVMGELALVTRHPRRSTVVCTRDAELLLVPRSAFSKLMEQFPEVAHRAVEVIRNDIGTYVAPLKNVVKKS